MEGFDVVNVMLITVKEDDIFYNFLTVFFSAYSSFCTFKIAVKDILYIFHNTVVRIMIEPCQPELMSLSHSKSSLSIFSYYFITIWFRCNVR